MIAGILIGVAAVAGAMVLAACLLCLIAEAVFKEIDGCGKE